MLLAAEPALELFDLLTLNWKVMLFVSNSRERERERERDGMALVLYVELVTA